jgi:hypothetical protein
MKPIESTSRESLHLEMPMLMSNSHDRERAKALRIEHC